jgi:hypothetical protein
MVKSPVVAVLSAPKSSTIIALFDALVLYRRAPLAVNETLENVRSTKSAIAVVLEAVGVTLVNALPPPV